MKDLKNLMSYKDALLDAKKEMDALIKRYSSVKPRDSYDETFQKARLMGYKDAIHRINTLIEKYDSEKHEYPIFDNLNEAANNYAENNYLEFTETHYDVGGDSFETDVDDKDAQVNAFKAGAKWQMEKDFNFFTGEMGAYDPNMEISDEDKLAALKYAYDMDAYVEGKGPCISDVINGYYGGLLAQRKKEKDDLMKDALDGYVSIGGKRRLISILDGMKGFKFGEKIKAIIIKTDKDNK